MTIYDKGLLRAMKAAYKDDGYEVALTEAGLLIQTDNWGVIIHPKMVPNSIKSLIVLHSGAMPRMDTAVRVQKDECGDVITEAVTGPMETLNCNYAAKGGMLIKPTRLTFDGKRVWQLTENLDVRLVDPDNQQILMFMYGEKLEVYLVAGMIYSRLPYGCCVYIRPETIMPEDRQLLQHLSQMQWIPVDLV